MAKNFFNRYVWLIDTIRRHGYMTFSDISDLWQKASINEDGSFLPERTFFNHREAISDIFGIEIKFDKSLGYYITEDSNDTKGIRSWLLTSLSVNNLINESAAMRGRILLEKIPSGEKYLSTVIEAMKDGKVLEMSYRKFQDDEPRTCDVAPYCVKVYKQRWYMLAKPSDRKSGLHIYALDRIHMLQQTRKDFRLPEHFKAESYFANWFGIVHDEDYEPCTIRLKVRAKQRDYFRTLPLHHSQKETRINDGWSVFEYYMAPTWDLEQELLQYSDGVEVLEPQSLRDQMTEHAKNILDLYR